ncbi:MAG: pallilysin-related adhesin [Treponema sp.]|jgi:PAS domain-containing protein|nr:pallilysin-related adhesin [Treponema sp.]
MTKKYVRFFTIAVFLLTAGFIGVLVFLPVDSLAARNQEDRQTRVVIPQATGGGEPAADFQDQDSGETQIPRISLNEDESALAALVRDFNGDNFEDQIIAYRRHQEIDSPVFITYAGYDPAAKRYVREWSAPAAVTRAGTLNLYGEDLIGDGGICVLISGMNGAGEQTLTVFRKNSGDEAEPFGKIAEFLVEGYIVVEDREPSAARRSLSIATYARDYESSNMLDQIEKTYTYNQINGLYEQSRVVKIPGSQIEQRRLSELLNGAPGQFEDFIDGLWRQGDGPGEKYVYFNRAARELIFYNNHSEEIFTWQDSSPTRYGLHINSRNISLTKLRRTVNVELSSLESVRLRVFQDEYLRTGPSTSWDGSYQRVRNAGGEKSPGKVNPYLDGGYSGPDGTIHFYRDGSYALTPASGPAGLNQRGKYVFFTMGEQELLELRPGGENGDSPDRKNPSSEPERALFTVNREGENYYSPDALSLTRIRISTRGVQDLHEAVIALTRD